MTLGRGVWFGGLFFALSYSSRALKSGVDRPLALVAAAIAALDVLGTLAVLAFALFG